MPHYFQLSPVETPDKPAKLVQVDEAMCAYFDVPCDPDKWYRSWFDIEGFACALGWTWDQLRQHHAERGNDDRIPIVDFLASQYVVTDWSGR